MYYACDSATIIYQRRKKRGGGGLGGWEEGVQGLEPPKHFKSGAEHPKIIESVAEIATNCVSEVLDFKILWGRIPGPLKNAITDYLHVDFGMEIDWRWSG